MLVPPRMLSEDGSKGQSDRTIILWGVNVGDKQKHLGRGVMTKVVKKSIFNFF